MFRCFCDISALAKVRYDTEYHAICTLFALAISIPIRNIPKGYIAFGLPNISQHSPHHMEAVLYRKSFGDLYRLGVSRDAAYSGQPIVYCVLHHLQGDIGVFHAEQSVANSRSEYHSAIRRNITLPLGRISLARVASKYHYARAACAYSLRCRRYYILV